MIDPALTPTRLVRPDERRPVDVRPLLRRSRLRRVAIGLRFLMWLFAALVRRSHRTTSDEAARRFKAVLQELGGLWYMAGQLLSQRVDLFSPALCRELSSLQMRAHGFPFDAARAVVEQELGRPLDTVFDEFEPAPFAATWVCQIHRARLRRERDWVAVKVQRPDLAREFADDLRTMTWMVRLLEWLGVEPSMRWSVGLWELRQIAEQEADFQFEASAIERMRANLRSRRLYVPALLSQYSTSRLLVTEFLHAALVSDVVRLDAGERPRVDAWLQQNGIERRTIARRLFHAFMRQMFEDNFYHGDLYPGNIVLLRDNRLALLHFGQCGFTDREYLQKVRLFFRTLATRDYTKAAELTLLLCTTLPAIDVERVKEDLVRALRAWTARTYVAELPYDQKSIDNATVVVLRVLFEHGCSMDWGFLRLRRALSILDASLSHLFPDVNYSDLCEEYFRKADKRQLRKELGPGLTTRVASGALRTLDIQERVAEFSMFYGSIIRRNAQVFQGTTDSFSYLAGVVVTQVALVLLVVAALLGAVIADFGRPGLVEGVLGPDLVRFVPRLGAGAWVLLLGVDLYLAAAMWGLRRRFLTTTPRSGGSGLGI